MTRRRKKREGRYAYYGLERIIHEKARLSILTSLAANPEGLLFTDLKEFCALTDGNLARHLQALKEASLDNEPLVREHAEWAIRQILK